MKILVLGASGMLGSTLYRQFFLNDNENTFGTIRAEENKKFFKRNMTKNLLTGIDIIKIEKIEKIFDEINPEIVINCIGIINKYKSAKDPLKILPINTLFPHKLSQLCKKLNIRLIQPSTDCVFSGSKGNYKETDPSDAVDLYGKSKYLGEIHDQEHVLTLRTSLIGHELYTKNELLEWFLSQDKSVQGFSKAIFSGLPTTEFARVLIENVLPKKRLFGLYHVSSAPISKLDFLKITSNIYKKKIQIIADDSLKIDRTLNSKRFQQDFGYQAPDWENLILNMYQQQPRAES